MDNFKSAELAYAVSEGKCVLFVGSGLSKHTSDLPVWSDFVKHIWRDLKLFDYSESNLNEENIEAYPLEYLEYAKTAFSNRYYNLVQQQLQLEQAGPTPDIYKIIASLPWTAIITTNLDTLLEDAFKEQRVATIVVDSEEDLSNIGTQEGMLIIKMHGSVLNHHSQVLTRFEYLDFDYRRHGMKAIVLSLFTQFPTLIIGAGITDPNFLKIYGIAHQVMGQFKHNAYYLGYGVPKFVRKIWKEKKFDFIKVRHEDLTMWFKGLKEAVDNFTSTRDSRKPSSFLNLYLKEAAMLSLGEVLGDYRAIQQRYLDQVHIPDYGWFTKPWETSLYGKLRPAVLKVMQNMNHPNKMSMLYVAPGPHAPLFSDMSLLKEFKKVISKITVADILPSVVFTAAAKLQPQLEIKIESAIEDLTAGCGDALCNVLLDLSKEKDIDVLLTRIGNTDAIMSLVLPQNSIKAVAASAVEKFKNNYDNYQFDVVYSEMVASFMGTAPLIGFRSAIYKSFQKNDLTKVDMIIQAAEKIWKRFNDAIFDLHVHILGELVANNGMLIIATDTQKIFDDPTIAGSHNFTGDEPTVTTDVVRRDNRFEINFLWRDHAVAFDIKIAGISVKDFLRHQHRVDVFIYRK
jgi:hypothetical protein